MESGLTMSRYQLSLPISSSSELLTSWHNSAHCSFVGESGLGAPDAIISQTLNLSDASIVSPRSRRGMRAVYVTSCQGLLGLGDYNISFISAMGVDSKHARSSSRSTSTTLVFQPPRLFAAGHKSDTKNSKFHSPNFFGFRSS